MSLLTTNVSSTYVDPSFTPLGGVPVVATLMGSNFTLSGVTVNREEKTYTQSIDPYVNYQNTPIVGKWTLALSPNAFFGEDSYYLIRVGAKEEYEIVVPVTVGETPVEMKTLIRNDTAPELLSIFTGKMTLTGDLVVNGDIEVTGILTNPNGYVENVELDIDNVPTFPGSLKIIGDLSVSGTITARGTVTVGS